MNKVSIALLLTGLSFGAVQAQSTSEETFTITRVKKGEEPQAVMTALKTDFPDVIVKDVAFLPGALYGREWAVSEQNDTDQNTDVQYYQVTAEGKGQNYTAVYDKTGKMVSYKEKIRNATLPEAVTSILSDKFAAWKMTGDQERIKYGNEGMSMVYRVELAKGKEHEHVFVDNSGKVLRRVKKLRV